VLEKFRNSLKGTIYITTIFEDKAGGIWFGTKESGLFKYNKDLDKGTHYVYNPKNTTGLASNFINVVFQDDFNVLWIGTEQGGINKLNLNQKPFYNYTNNPYEKSSISDNLLTSVLEDNTGKL
jgi:ligand-binding sensor domain-containing protein